MHFFFRRFVQLLALLCAMAKDDPFKESRVFVFRFRDDSSTMKKKDRTPSTDP